MASGGSIRLSVRTGMDLAISPAGLLRVIHNSWGECGTVDVPHLVFTATEVTDAIERSRDLPL